MSFLKSQYYDQPDGNDAFGKIVATNKFAVAGGLAWGTIDVLMLTKTQGYIPTLARFAYNIGPFMGMASAFTLATYVSTNVRGKDDKLNYLIGGMAAGGVYGAWKRNHVAGLVMGVFFGIAGVVKKLSKEEGWEFFPTVPTHEYGSLSGTTHDYTLMAERPKNWSKGE